MPNINPHIRHGFASVRPYLHGPFELPSFVCKVFGAVEIERHEHSARKAHVELQIADSILVIEAADSPKSIASQVYVYVADVDAVYARALEHGANPISAPEDMPYQERACGFKDVAGNTWWVASYTG